MDARARKKVGRALAKIVHEELIDRREITVPGWGTFTVEHRGGHTEPHEQTVSVHPPKERILFQPERL